MDEPGRYCAECQKPVHKDQALYDCTEFHLQGMARNRYIYGGRKMVRGASDWGQGGDGYELTGSGGD